MNAERLLAHYEKIADAPNAIARLRRFILDLAVRGKLVQQDPKDEPASELLKRIAKEKARLVKAGELSKFTESTTPLLSDLAFEIPACWHPAKIENVLDELQTGPFGSSLHQSDYRVGGTPVINPASIQNDRIVAIEKMAVDSATVERLASFKLRLGDVVMARRGEMGRCAIVTEHEVGWLCGTGSLILRPSKYLFANFLVLLIGSPFGRQYLGETAVGTTMQNLNQSILLRLPFGLPPLAEQHRIVAKVDELMGLCDRLEAARASREATRDRLAAASLARLNAPDAAVRPGKVDTGYAPGRTGKNESSPAKAGTGFASGDAAEEESTFRADARFALDALPALITTRPDQIKALRQTILNLAVRGKLVPQNASDEPASKLLARVPSLPKPARYEKRSPELIPGDCGVSINHPGTQLPLGWLWVPLVQIARLESGHTPSRNRPAWWGGDVPWIGLVDARLHNNGTIYETIQTTNEDGLANSAARLLPKGTVCFSRTASVGYVVIMGRPMATSQDFVNWVPTEAISSSWLQLVMIAERPAIGRFSKGAVHQTIYYPAWLSMHVALPPLAEQHRIVAKVDALMALCDRLEASLTAAAATRRRLLDALLAEALTPAQARELEPAE